MIKAWAIVRLRAGSEYLTVRQPLVRGLDPKLLTAAQETGRPRRGVRRQLRKAMRPVWRSLRRRYAHLGRSVTICCACLVFSGGAAHATTNAEWVGGSGDFSDPNHWVNQLPPTSGPDTILTFPGEASSYFPNNNLPGPLEVNTVNFGGGAQGPTISGNTFIFSDSTGGMNPLISQNPAAGRAGISNDLIINSNQLDFQVINPTPSGALLLFGQVSESGGPAALNVTGGGILGIFGPGNTFTGGVTVDGSEVHVGNQNDLGAGRLTLIDSELFANQVVDLTGRNTNVGGGGGVFNAGQFGSQIVVDDLTNVATGTISVGIIGPGATNLQGTSNLGNGDVLLVDNSTLELSGPAPIGNAQLLISDSTIIGNGAVDLTGNTVQIENGQATIETGDALSSLAINDIGKAATFTSTLGVQGPGVVNLGGTSNFDGGDRVLVDNSTLQLGGPAPIGDAQLLISDSTIVGNGAVDLTGNTVQVEGSHATLETGDALSSLAIDGIGHGATFTIAVGIKGPGVVNLGGTSNFDAGDRVLVDHSTLQLGGPAPVGNADLLLTNSTLIANGPVDLRGNTVQVDGNQATLQTDTFFAPLVIDNLGKIATSTSTMAVNILGPGYVELGGTGNFAPGDQFLVDNSELALSGPAPIGDAGLTLIDGRLYSPTGVDLTGNPFNIDGTQALIWAESGSEIAINNLTQVSTSTIAVTLRGQGVTALGGNSNLGNGDQLIVNGQLQVNGSGAVGNAGVLLDDATLIVSGNTDLRDNLVSVDGPQATLKFDTPSSSLLLEDFGKVGTSTMVVNIMGPGSLHVLGTGNFADGDQFIVEDASLRLRGPAPIGDADLLLNGTTLIGDGAGLTNNLIEVSGSSVLFEAQSDGLILGERANVGPPVSVTYTGFGDRITLAGPASGLGPALINNFATVATPDGAFFGSPTITLEQGTIQAQADIITPSMILIAAPGGCGFDASGGDIVVPDLLGGPGTILRKSGPHGLRIDDAGNFVGIVQLDAGTAELHGATVPLVNASPNTNIAGNFTITGNTALPGGNTLSPGNVVDLPLPPGAPGSAAVSASSPIGTLEFAGGLDMNNVGNQFIWQLAALVDQATGQAGVDFDQIVLSGGGLTLGSLSELAIEFVSIPGPDSGASFWLDSHSWKIIDVTGTGSNPGELFQTIANGDFAAGSFGMQLGSGADAGDVFLVYDAIPEPGTFVIGCIGGLLITLRRRPIRPQA